ncbi:C2H2 transcription factor [Ceratocystis lukuohia]|uniref:C2H2 transcription factor n=1 Tax=Ceratocystis lukuohia TaxID=2019550 RepID=A0ABR4MQB9_9PEZI
MYADSQQQSFGHRQQQQHSQPSISHNIPMRPVTPMTSEAATTLSMINSSGQGRTPGTMSQSPAHAARPTAPHAVHSKPQENEAKSAEGTSDSDHEDENNKRKRSKKRPHKFYCTDYPPCTLSFTRSEHLSRHIRRHTGERPFTCHCNRAFTRLDNLRQHAQTVHANEPIPADSLAAQGGRGHRHSMARKRASISQHPVATLPATISSAHSRSMSTPIHYRHPQYMNSFNTTPSSGPVGSVLAAPAGLYQQHPPHGPQGQMMGGPWGHQPHSQPPPPPQNQHQHQSQDPSQLHHHQQPQQIQPPQHGYGAQMAQHQDRVLAPVIQGNGHHAHGHNRARSLMTPGEILRPAPSHLRDNFDRVRRPSQAPSLGPSSMMSQQPPSQAFPPHGARNRGHVRGQSHGAFSLAPGPGPAPGPMGNGANPPRGFTSEREWRLANQPKFNLQEELARIRLGSSANGSNSNTASAGNNGKNSQSPVTPTEDYYHQAHSPVASPTFPSCRDFTRDRASLSSFDPGRGLLPRDRTTQNPVVPGPLPPHSGHHSQYPGSLAPFSRGGGGGHSRSQSWNTAVPDRVDTPPITLPRLNYDEKDVRKNRLGANPLEPDIRM